MPFVVLLALRTETFGVKLGCDSKESCISGIRTEPCALCDRIQVGGGGRQEGTCDGVQKDRHASTLG